MKQPQMNECVCRHLLIERDKVLKLLGNLKWWLHDKSNIQTAPGELGPIFVFGF